MHESLGVSNNDKCMHNPMFYIIKRKYVQVQGMFDSLFICHSVFNSFFMQICCHVLCTTTRMKVW